MFPFLIDIAFFVAFMLKFLPFRNLGVQDNYKIPGLFAALNLLILLLTAIIHCKSMFGLQMYWSF